MPFEKIRVGRGLNNGYTGAPTGGFHDISQRDYAMPKNVDQLRAANNPKLQYKGRIHSGKSNIDNRGLIGEVIKTTPDKFYINDGVERAFTTTGAYVKDRQRPTILIKDTNRQCTSVNEYTGVAEAMTNKQATHRSMVKQSTRQNYYTDGVRNATAADHWTDNSMGDYGKQGLFLPSQEREVTGLRTHVSNVSSVLKAFTAPLMDSLKTTKKENVIGNANRLDMLKLLFSKVKYMIQMMLLERQLKKHLYMMREQVITNSADSLKPTIYDPNDVARTTIKETLIHDSRTGHYDRAVTQDGQGYLTNEKEAPNTNRQFTSDWEYEGIANGNTEVGGQGPGYLTNEKEAPNTNRQFTSDYEYVGGAMSKEPSQKRYDYMYNANLNEVREGTLVGRSPTNSNVALYVGMDKINMETKKLDGDRVNTRELSKTKVYNSLPQYNPCQVTTNKDQLNNDVLYDRNNPDLLNAFRDNPYTQSLNSAPRNNFKGAPVVLLNVNIKITNFNIYSFLFSIFNFYLFEVIYGFSPLIPKLIHRIFYIYLCFVVLNYIFLGLRSKDDISVLAIAESGLVNMLVLVVVVYFINRDGGPILLFFISTPIVVAFGVIASSSAFSAAFSTAFSAAFSLPSLNFLSISIFKVFNSLFNNVSSLLYRISFSFFLKTDPIPVSKSSFVGKNSLIFVILDSIVLIKSAFFLTKSS